jgi:hypothetical protein
LGGWTLVTKTIGLVRRDEVSTTSLEANTDSVLQSHQAFG